MHFYRPQITLDPGQRAFATSPAACVVARGGPLTGKTNALLARAWATDKHSIWLGPEIDTPPQSRTMTEPEFAVHLAIALREGLDLDGLRLISAHEVQARVAAIAADLSVPGHPQRIAAAARQLRRSSEASKSALESATHRNRLWGGTAPLSELVSQLSASLQASGARLPETVIGELRQIVRANTPATRDILRRLAPGGLFVDDFQLLSAPMADLILEIAAHCPVSMTMSPLQRVMVSEGMPAAETLARFTARGFALHDFRYSYGMSAPQAQAALALLNRDRNPPFKAMAEHPWALHAAVHKADEGIVASLASVAAPDEATTICVACPTQALVEVIAESLEAEGVRFGRLNHVGLLNPGYVLCSELVRAMLDPEDVSAIRTVAELFIADSAQFEAHLQTCIGRGQGIFYTGSDGVAGADLDLAPMREWLESNSGSPTGELMARISTTPLWQGAPELEAGILHFIGRAQRAGLHGLGEGGWGTFLASSACEAPAHPPAVGHGLWLGTMVEVSRQHPDETHVVGFAKTLIPRPCPAAEAPMEAELLATVLANTKSKVVLHYAASMRLAPGLSPQDLVPSPYAVPLALDMPVEVTKPKRVKKPRLTFKP